MDEIKLKSISKWTIRTVSICILIYLSIQNLDVVFTFINKFLNIFKPLLIGGVIAIVLNILVNVIEEFFKSKNIKISRYISILLSLILTIGIIVILCVVIVPEMVEATTLIVLIIHDLLETLSNIESTNLISSLDIDWKSIQTTIETWIESQRYSIVQETVDIVSILINHIITIFIGIIFSIYLMFNKEKIKKSCKRQMILWLPKKISNSFFYIFNILYDSFKRFIVGQVIEAVILGCLCCVGMFILRIPYAIMISVLIGVTALIPYFGAMIGMCVGAIMILTISPMKALIFIIYITILQQVEGNFIYPKIVGARINLPAIWVFASVIVGGNIAGPIGMLFSVPILAGCYRMINDLSDIREKELMKNDRDC